MRILLLHNYYRQRGGEDVVVEAEKRLLEEKGHEVVLVKADNNKIGGLRTVGTAFSAIYSFSSRKLVSESIRKFLPDIVHVHNFFPLLSPSVLDACKKAEVPVVQTLHNFRLICPGALLFRDGSPCEKCMDMSVPWPAVIYRCYRRSYMQTFALAAMIATHKFFGTWLRLVDAFIALTEFQKKKFVNAGLPEERIYLKPNFILDKYVRKNATARKRYALYVGRVSKEKGADRLIEAYIHHGLRFPLKVAGEGPLLPELKEKVKSAGLCNIIEFLGFKSRGEVASLMSECSFIVFPSVCYEGLPITIIEAFAKGAPVLASGIGSMLETVKNGQTGLHFMPGEAGEITKKISWAATHPEEMEQMGKMARLEFDKHYSQDANYVRLLSIYHKAQDSRRVKA